MLFATTAFSLRRRYPRYRECDSICIPDDRDDLSIVLQQLGRVAAAGQESAGTWIMRTGLRNHIRYRNCCAGANAAGTKDRSKCSDMDQSDVDSETDRGMKQKHPLNPMPNQNGYGQPTWRSKEKIKVARNTQATIPNSPPDCLDSKLLLPSHHLKNYDDRYGEISLSQIEDVVLTATQFYA